MIPKTLAELIREGAQLHPQGFHHLFHNGRTCVWGAAHEALTGFPIALPTFEGLGADLDCPACFKPPPYGGLGIDHLNDDHHWTRERIADYLDTFFVQPFALIPESRPWLMKRDE